MLGTCLFQKLKLLELRKKSYKSRQFNQYYKILGDGNMKKYGNLDKMRGMPK